MDAKIDEKAMKEAIEWVSDFCNVSAVTARAVVSTLLDMFKVMPSEGMTGKDPADALLQSQNGTASQPVADEQIFGGTSQCLPR